MKTKIIRILVCILFFVASVVSGIDIQIKETRNSSRGNTLYVGGIGVGNYSKIQDAIDNATDGDTVFVYNDSSPYVENVVINISINLIGEDKNTTIINGGSSGDAIFITANWTNVSGFTFTGGRTIEEMGAGLELNAQNCHIYHNNCSNNEYGIWIQISTNNTIVNNICNSNIKEGIILCESDNNIIEANNCSNNGYFGIFLGCAEDSNSNTIKGNILSGNSLYGIGIGGPSTSNHIYHNNLINNTPQNANDGGTNLWDNGYPSGGNYWSDYTGIDSDGNGIGDTPYNISDGSNKDYYPLMNPWGENLPVANFTYSIYASSVLFDGSSSYDRDGEIISYEWDFGDGNTGSSMIIYHNYSNIGTFLVTLTVIDDNGYKGEITRTIEIVLNEPPDVPIINGPNLGIVGRKYSYLFISEDPENNDVYYEILWGDGTFEEWIGPYNSNEVVVVNHSWNSQGTYVVMARAKDEFNNIGDWGNISVIMLRNRVIQNTMFFNFLENYPLLYQFLQLLFQLLELQ